MTQVYFAFRLSVLLEWLAMLERCEPENLRFDDQGYIRLVLPYIKEEQTHQEVGRIKEALALGKGGTVLDVGCGNGRHATILARDGYRVIGVDSSCALLEIAQAPLRIQADMRQLPLIDKSVDGAYSIFSSFGFYGEEGDMQTLGEIARVVKEKGRLLLETFIRDDLSSVPYSHIWRDGNHLTIQDIWSFERTNNLLAVTRYSSNLDWAVLRVHLYSQQKLYSMLSCAAFEVVSATITPVSLSVAPEIPLQRLSLVGQKR